MNKMNKKGFTLIEMLVVIAIIAVLVSIIIPTVTSATDKAAAASNAANLRSIKAEVVTAYLTNDTSNYTFTGGVVGVVSTGNASAKSGNVTWQDVSTDFITKAGITAPATTAEGSAAGFYGEVTGDVIKVYYKGYSIDQWAQMAGNKASTAAADDGK